MWQGVLYNHRMIMTPCHICSWLLYAETREEKFTSMAVVRPRFYYESAARAGRIGAWQPDGQPPLRINNSDVNDAGQGAYIERSGNHVWQQPEEDRKAGEKEEF